MLSIIIKSVLIVVSIFAPIIMTNHTANLYISNKLGIFDILVLIFSITVALGLNILVYRKINGNKTS
jgi:hypothetical protein